MAEKPAQLQCTWNYSDNSRLSAQRGCREFTVFYYKLWEQVAQYWIAAGQQAS
jgi:hypothetical protein